MAGNTYNAGLFAGSPWLGLGENWGQTAAPSTLPIDNSLLNNMPTVAGATPGIMDQLSGIFNQKSLFGGKAMDGTVTNGWAMPALNIAQGLGNAFLGMKQYGLAKDSLEASKRQFEINFGANKKLTNGRLEDRQAARVASNPGAYQSVGDYMKKNGI